MRGSHGPWCEPHRSSETCTALFSWSCSFSVRLVVQLKRNKSRGEEKGRGRLEARSTEMRVLKRRMETNYNTVGSEAYVCLSGWRWRGPTVRFYGPCGYKFGQCRHFCHLFFVDICYNAGFWNEGKERVLRLFKPFEAGFLIFLAHMRIFLAKWWEVRLYLLEEFVLTFVLKKTKLVGSLVVNSRAVNDV